ncbi:MAG: SUMF1/EgtB/PvdO family nonheme iron enzyme [Treponema sp.]|nr:SUMF1/EgtB/PvdO family nonheme iron enzyme [Candidatus Treponema merdequi]
MKRTVKLTGIVSALCLGICFVSCGKNELAVKLEDGTSINFIEVPENNYCITTTEITQKFYKGVTGENPSKTQGDDFPVESVSYYDAVVFCNKLSLLQKKTPCYSVNGTANPEEWNYTPHTNTSIEDKIELNLNADGYRIPTMDEWDIAIRGGEKFMYSGSDDLDSVAWTDCNSGKVLHEVAKLKPNAFGLYDMSGNVFEWVWSERDDGSRYYRGGSYFDAARAGKVTNKEMNYASGQFKTVGFRITWNKPVKEGI